MPKINYHEARQSLSQAFEHYLAHNQTQLDALKGTSPTTPVEHFFMRAKGGFPGFWGWMSCKYAEIMDDIFRLNCSDRRPRNIFDYGDVYPPCESKITFIDLSYEQETTDCDPYNEYSSIHPMLVLDRLSVLVGLFHYVMIKENSEPDFEKNFQTYKSKNVSDSLCLESDPVSIKIYKTLKELKHLSCFVNDTLPKYQSKNMRYLVSTIEESFSVLEGYIKSIVVWELKFTLDDMKLSDEDSVKALSVQLQNKDVLDILGKNRQSQTEHILKVISVVLIAVGIGIIPTVILAAKRLYDSGGTSINFFKPLSMNLCEDASGITAEVEQDLKIS